MASCRLRRRRASEHLAPPPQWIARRPSVRASVDQPRPLTTRISPTDSMCSPTPLATWPFCGPVRWKSVGDLAKMQFAMTVESDTALVRLFARAGLVSPCQTAWQRSSSSSQNTRSCHVSANPALAACRAGSSPRGATGLRPSCAADSWRLGRWRRCGGPVTQGGPTDAHFSATCYWNSLPLWPGTEPLMPRSSSGGGRTSSRRGPVERARFSRAE